MQDLPTLYPLSHGGFLGDPFQLRINKISPNYSGKRLEIYDERRKGGVETDRVRPASGFFIARLGKALILG